MHPELLAVDDQLGVQVGQGHVPQPLQVQRGVGLAVGRVQEEIARPGVLADLARRPVQARRVPLAAGLGVEDVLGEVFIRRRGVAQVAVLAEQRLVADAGVGKRAA